MRLFIALPLNDRIISKIGALQEELKDAAGSDEKIKWVSPAKVHLTLKFLGEVEETKISSIKYAIKEALVSFNPYNVYIENGGFFPSARRPRVIWVGLRDKKRKTVELKRSIDCSMVRLGFEKETRKFIPHLTLGRLKIVTGRSLAVRKLLENEIYIGKLIIDRINLYESIIGPKGPEYRVAASFRF